MKQIGFFIIGLLCMAFVQSCSAPRDFSDLARTQGVSMTYFGPGMTDMIGSALNSALGANVNLSGAKITGMRVIKAENRNAVKKTHTLVMSEVRAVKAVPVMELAKGGSHKYAAVYASVDPVSGNYRNVSIMIEQPDRSVTVILQGNLTSGDLDRLRDIGF